MKPTPAALAYLREAAETWGLDEAKYQAALMRDGVIESVDGQPCLEPEPPVRRTIAQHHQERLL